MGYLITTVAMETLLDFQCLMFVGVPQPKLLHRFSANFPDIFTPRKSRADYILGVSGYHCCNGNTFKIFGS